MTEYAAVCCCGYPPEGCFCGNKLNYACSYSVNEYSHNYIGGGGFLQSNTGVHETKVNIRDSMTSVGSGSCRWTTSSSDLIDAEHYMRSTGVSMYTSGGDTHTTVNETTVTSAPQFTREDAPTGDPYFGSPSSEVDDGLWQERSGGANGYVMLPGDGCCEASILPNQDKTYFRIKFRMVLIKETTSQYYVNGNPEESNNNEAYREFVTEFRMVTAIYSGSNGCDGAGGLVCNARGTQAYLGHQGGWSKFLLEPTHHIGDLYCPSIFYRMPGDVRYSWQVEGAGIDYDGRSRFRVSSMNFTDSP